MHSNPIIITFCSLLYYKDLSDHIRNHRIEKLIKRLDKSIEECYKLRPSNFNKKPVMNEYEFHPFVNGYSINYAKRRNFYNQKIVNKWHLLIRLSFNIELIKYRKHRINNSRMKTKSNKYLSVKARLIISKVKDEVKEKLTITNRTILETKF